MKRLQSLAKSIAANRGAVQVPKLVILAVIVAAALFAAVVMTASVSTSIFCGTTKRALRLFGVVVDISSPGDLPSGRSVAAVDDLDHRVRRPEGVAATVKRVGWALESFGAQEDVLAPLLGFPVTMTPPLDPRRARKGPVIPRWKLQDNLKEPVRR